jgi:hypothetical protein
MNISAILDKARAMLSGEPARAIGYGAAVVVYLVAKASGAIADVPLDQAVLQTTSAIAVVVSVIESIRRFVYSPASVTAIIEELDPVSDPADG